MVISGHRAAGLVRGDFTNRYAAETTGACCYRLPGPVRILNVLTGLFLSTSIQSRCRRDSTFAPGPVRMDSRLRGNDMVGRDGKVIDMDDAVALLHGPPQRLVAIDGLPVSGK